MIKLIWLINNIIQIFVKRWWKIFVQSAVLKYVDNSFLFNLKKKYYFISLYQLEILEKIYLLFRSSDVYQDMISLDMLDRNPVLYLFYK